jgi:hypothetical protein
MTTYTPLQGDVVEFLFQNRPTYGIYCDTKAFHDRDNVDGAYVVFLRDSDNQVIIREWSELAQAINGLYGLDDYFPGNLLNNQKDQKRLDVAKCSFVFQRSIAFPGSQIPDSQTFVKHILKLNGLNWIWKERPLSPSTW